MHYPANGILKANFVTCVSQIRPGTVIRMGFPDIHDAQIKHHYFGVVTIVTMQADATGSETPAVIRVHWGDDTFNDFCFLNSEDFSFRALVSCVNDFAVFRQGHLRGVDALRWSLIRKFESCVQAARPCCATIRFSSPRRTRPEYCHVALRQEQHQEQTGQNHFQDVESLAKQRKQPKQSSCWRCRRLLPRRESKRHEGQGQHDIVSLPSCIPRHEHEERSPARQQRVDPVSSLFVLQGMQWPRTNNKTSKKS